jgi:hypothetical protein
MGDLSQVKRLFWRISTGMLLWQVVTHCAQITHTGSFDCVRLTPHFAQDDRPEGSEARGLRSTYNDRKKFSSDC